ncbi:MAG: response regulator [Betaproteobacteria bacterium]|nr:response regulator [Betaproteobacteria bacterium]
MADDDLSSSVALVIDGNQTSRSILVTQLKDFGMGEVVQASRIALARQMLESRTFDVVLCEQDFESPGDTSTGQDLLDDLRRNQLLPFSTVFIMVTGQASYSKVAEAAESALDGYLLKPHKASNLGIRLRQARHRKSTLQAIFTAIEAHEFDRAARMCVDRFRNKDDYWLYSARVGAELMLRTGQHTLALALYEAVVAARALPWAKLGIARAVMEAGQLGKARKALEALVQEDPGYAEASDALATIQFEQGQYGDALGMC